MHSSYAGQYSWTYVKVEPKFMNGSLQRLEVIVQDTIRSNVTLHFNRMPRASLSLHNKLVST